MFVPEPGDSRTEDGVESDARAYASVVHAITADVDSSVLRPYLAGLQSQFGGVMHVRDARDGRYLLVNKAFEELAGLPADEILGRTSHDLFPAGMADEHRAHDRQVLREGVAQARKVQALDSAGVARSYVSHKFPLYDAAGNAFAVGAISMDVTAVEAERRWSREARLDSEARFRAVFEHAQIGQIYSNMEGAVTSVNGPMAAMLGYTPDEMVGRSALSFVGPAEGERIRTATAALLAGDESSVSDIRRFRHKDGHAVPVRVSSALLRTAAGEPQWWVSMVVDISDEERTRSELEQAHRAAVLSAERLQLLHAIATAANEATTLVELAPRLLESVCVHFGWDAGALLGWPAQATAATAIVAHGALPAGIGDLPAPNSPLSPVVARPDGTVVVPLTGNRSGRLAWVFRAGSTPLDADQLEVLQLIGIESTRVVEREAAADMLRDSEARFRSVFDSSPLPMGLTIDDAGTYAAVNDALCELLGLSKAELVGMSARDVCHPDDRALTEPAGAAAAAAPDGRHQFELRFLHSSGRAVTTNTTLAWMDGPDGSRHLLAQIEDITARRTVEEVLRRQAEQDGLTGLANRSHLARVLAEKAAAGSACAVLFIDLDGFKLINDTRGHDVGDEVLQTVAARLRASVRPSDLVVRFGGDEFVVLCAAGGGDDETGIAQQVADRVEASLAEPMTTQAGPATVTASIGIAGGVVDVSRPQDLVQRADTAMYEAKRLGKDRQEIYDIRLHERARQHQRTEAALRNALADDRFVVHYQPIVRLADSAIVGFEALVRLVDEAGNLVAPDKFIAVAEQSGLIVPMGAWVLRESCRAIARLRELTGRPLTIAVNIAARQAARPDLADVVRAALDAAGLPENALTLELTESALLEADESTLSQLVRLRKQGVVIGLDDFGTGYSSLTYLRRFPVSHLKVDRSFVAGVAVDASDRAIVRAVTRLADELGLRWVAEGVETVEQRDELAAMGSGLAQGYLFSRPVREEQLPALLGLVEEPSCRRSA